jgi:stage III sporulation protein AA
LARFKTFTDGISKLIQILPKPLSEILEGDERLSTLSEVVLDLGRPPEVRFFDSIQRFTELDVVTQDDLDSVVSEISDFNTDNRAGIERTLHRISCLRNRKSKIIGLTCRVGRAVVGTIEIIRDLIESDDNILFLGPPGIGKTTKLRETARVLSDDLGKRVVVVDTSNEIAGDGDIPHIGIGSARRMQVPSPDKQHSVMIEAVENHGPEVIIVDEIGTEEEASAARTIAERGVKLVATAHGYNIENLIKNPTLSDMVGGIQSVILGDEEAKFRGTQKTVLERKTLPTFQTIIEIRERDVFAIYQDVKKCVDSYLRGTPLPPETRKWDEGGEISIEKPDPDPDEKEEPKQIFKPELTVFPFGINEDSIRQVISILNVPMTVAKSISDADLVLTIKSQVKNGGKVAQMLKGRNIPIHVIKQNSRNQVSQFFKDYFKLELSEEDVDDEALDEVKQICAQVIETGRMKEASPQLDHIRKIQHEYITSIDLNSMSVGEEPNRRVRIYPKKN